MSILARVTGEAKQFCQQFDHVTYIDAHVESIQMDGTQTITVLLDLFGKRTWIKILSSFYDIPGFVPAFGYRIIMYLVDYVRLDIDVPDNGVREHITTVMRCINYIDPPYETMIHLILNLVSPKCRDIGGGYGCLFEKRRVLKRISGSDAYKNETEQLKKILSAHDDEICDKWMLYFETVQSIFARYEKKNEFMTWAILTNKLPSIMCNNSRHNMAHVNGISGRIHKLMYCLSHKTNNNCRQLVYTILESKMCLFSALCENNVLPEIKSMILFYWVIASFKNKK